MATGQSERGPNAAGLASLPSETLAALDGDEFRARVFCDKYALRDNGGKLLEKTPSQMWRRLARELAAMEIAEQQQKWQRRFLWLLSDYRMVPGGRILHAVGNPNKVTALNCYVVPSPQDSVRGIYHTAWELAETFKRGGGCGVDISSLRPANAPVRNTARTSTGAVSFMEIYSLTTWIIGQHGRRGALMMTMADSHPDVLEFCKVKRNLTSVRYANISVRVTDALLQAAEGDDKWLLRYENPEDNIEIKRTIAARELWAELVKGAKDFAEPGCLFWDTTRRFSCSDRYPQMKVITTNPCGEEALEPYGDCCLGSLNLPSFILNPFTPDAKVDFSALEKATRHAVRLLDNVVSWNRDRHPLPEQEEAAERGRRIGLGVMGLADMLCQLRLKYDTDEGIEKAEKTLERIKIWAYDESANLAAEKGPFPAFAADVHFNNPFFDSFPPALVEKLVRQGLRNITLLTIPPTGSVAALSGTTSGIEPIFDLSYTRRSESLLEKSFDVVHPLVDRYRRTQRAPGDDPLPDYFTTAHLIHPKKRVLMQAALQRHIDQSISSTINLARDTSETAIENIYRDAWQAGCKGITVYREGSREDILRSEKRGGAPNRPQGTAAHVACRPAILRGMTLRQETPLGTAFVTINHSEEGTDDPFEVFVRLGKAGSDLEADAEAIGRLLSLILRLPSPMSRLRRVEEIVDQLEMIGGAHAIRFGPSRVRSLADGIARSLCEFLDSAGAAMSKVASKKEPSRPLDFCPRCRKAALSNAEGCMKCGECGFKEC